MEHTTTSPAHTPTPWIFGHSENADVYHNEPHWLIISDPNESTGEAIADVETGSGPETSEANAGFIVRACNAHEDLLRELKLASKFLGTIDPAAIIAAENELGIGLAPANIIAAIASAEPVPNDAHEHAA